MNPAGDHTDFIYGKKLNSTDSQRQRRFGSVRIAAAFFVDFSGSFVKQIVDFVSRRLPDYAIISSELFVKKQPVSGIPGERKTRIDNERKQEHDL